MLAEVVEQVVLAGLEGGRGEFGDRHVSRAAIAKLAPAALKAGKYDLLNHLG